MDIYVLVDNHPEGPYSIDQIRGYIATGRMQGDQLGAPAGSSDWKPLSTMMPASDIQVAGKGQRFGSPGAVAAAASAQKKRKAASAKSSRGSNIATILLVVILLGGGVGGYLWWKQKNGGGAAEVKVTTPVEPGFPNTASELNSWYAEPPGGQNAATLFVKGFDAMQVTNSDRESKDLPLIGKGSLPPPGGPLPVKTKAAITALIQRNKAIWEPFQQGAKLEQARYPMDLNQGFDTLLPHLAKIKPAVQLSGLSALLLADSKQPRAATEGLLNGLALAQSLKREPLLISQLVRVAALALEKANLEAVVNLTALPPAELERLATAFAKAEAEDSSGTPFARALGGERASCLATMDLPPEQIEAMLKKMGGRKALDGEGADSTDANATDKKLTKNIKGQRGFAEETFNQAIAMHKQSFPDRLKTDQYFVARVEEARTNDYQLCVALMTALGKQAVKEAGGLAQLRLAQTAIALERFRAANANRYPAALSELTPKFLPAVPQSPFDGQPLHYEKNGEGYELRGTGADSAKPLSFKVVRPAKPT